MNVVRVVLVAAVLLPGVGFARQMIGYYGRVGEPLGPLAAVLRDAPAGDGVVWVNPPQWVAPPARSYPFGTELAPLLGIHLFAAELLEANGLGNRPVAVLDAPGLRGEAPFPYGLYELTSVDQLDPAGLPAETSHVFITAYGEEGLATRYTGRLSGAGGRTPAAAAALGPFQLERAGAYACEAGLVVELVLLTAESPAPTLSLFVQALAADGRLLAQADGPPLGIPPGRLVWSPGLELVDSRLLPAGPDAAAELLVGAYDFTTGERLPAVDAAGRALPDSGVRLPVAGCLFPVGD